MTASPVKEVEKKIRAGDTIEVVPNKVDQPDRVGVVKHVLQDDPLCLEVDREDGRTSAFFPVSGNVRVRATAD